MPFSFQQRSHKAKEELAAKDGNSEPSMNMTIIPIPFIWCRLALIHTEMDFWQMSADLLENAQGRAREITSVRSGSVAFVPSVCLTFE